MSRHMVWLAGWLAGRSVGGRTVSGPQIAPIGPSLRPRPFRRSSLPQTRTRVAPKRTDGKTEGRTDGRTNGWGTG